METYYINLDRSTERRHRIEACLESFNLKYRRVKAVDANDLSDSEIRDCYDPAVNPYGYFSTLKKAEIACFLSHRKALKEFLDNSVNEFVLVLEDDAEFVHDPIPVFKALQEKISGSKEPLVIKLFSRRNNRKKKLMDLVQGIYLALPNICPLNTSAQIFNRSGALKFLECTKNIYLPIDVTLQFSSEMPLLVLQMQPNLVRGVSEEVGGSTISSPSQSISIDKVAREFRRIAFRFGIWFRTQIPNKRSLADIRLAITR